MVEKLGLSYERIDYGVKGCMLFYNDDIGEASNDVSFPQNF